MKQPFRRKRFRVIDGSKVPPVSEHKLQVQLLDYLRLAARPDCYYFAVPNQSNRHIRNAVKMKAEGARSGIADLCFMLPDGRTAWLEMKTPKGSLSDTQKGFRDICSTLGHSWACAKSVDEAIEFLTSVNALKPAYRRGRDFFSTNYLEEQLNQSNHSKGAKHGT